MPITLRSLAVTVSDELARRARLGTGKATTYSSEAILDDIRRFAREVNGGATPTYPLWRDLGPALGYVSAARIVQVFGRWRAALDAAGLEQNGAGTRRGHSSHFSREDCVDAVRACAAETGRMPSYAGYDAWQKSKRESSVKGLRGPYPSAQCVRQRVASKWTACLAEVFASGSPA